LAYLPLLCLLQAPTGVHFQFYAPLPADGAAAGAAAPAGAQGAAGTAEAAGSGLRIIDVPAVDQLPGSGEPTSLPCFLCTLSDALLWPQACLARPGQPWLLG
jgi:hypothetical protein